MMTVGLEKCSGKITEVIEKSWQFVHLFKCWPTLHQILSSLPAVELRRHPAGLCLISDILIAGKHKKHSYHRGTARRSMLVGSWYVSRGMAVRKVSVSKVTF